MAQGTTIFRYFWEEKKHYPWKMVSSARTSLSLTLLTSTLDYPTKSFKISSSHFQEQIIFVRKVQHILIKSIDGYESIGQRSLT